MHLFQAIKMACKSLWSNKLRSFLTMLGIIIGVTAVALLTSVASGVSDAVVSSIRSQSTLAALTNMSDKLTYKKTKDVIQSVQPTDPDADDYFKYSIVVSNSLIVAKAEKEFLEIEGIDVLDYLTAEKLYKKSDFPNYDSMSKEEKGLVEMITMKKKGALSTTVYAVDSNFEEVYEMTYTGSFPKTADEILVDDVFLSNFFPEYKNNYSSLIGEKITLGTKPYTQISVTFSEDITINTTVLRMIVSQVKNGFELPLADENSTTMKISLEIIPNEELNPNSDDTNAELDKLYSYNEETRTLTMNFEIYKYLTNSEILEIINSYVAMIPSNDEVPTSEKITARVVDKYDLSSAKEFTICGVYDAEENSVMSSMTSSSSSSSVSSSSNSRGSLLATYMQSMSSSKGICYVLLDDENAPCMTNGKNTEIDDAVIFFAYFRYKNEDVMGSSTTNLTLAFIRGAGVSYLQDFMLFSFSSVANIISNVMSILTIMLTVISIISLVVGGIGIMNIMLVAVSERTREIGIRKAIGAKKSSILTQFLVEALALSIFGGIFGLIFSEIGILIISHYMKITIIMPLWVIGMSVGFCSAIGLIFGMFPAIKASNMQPIDALRRE